MRIRILYAVILCLSLFPGCRQEQSAQDNWWQMRGLVLSTKELAEVESEFSISAPYVDFDVSD